MRQRWIEIGVLRLGWYVRHWQWGCPDGFRMDWRGRVAFFQPCEFLRWEEVLWAVCRRLHLAGLQLVAIACQLPLRPTGYTWHDVTLRALVQRGDSEAFLL